MPSPYQPTIPAHSSMHPHRAPLIPALWASCTYGGEEFLEIWLTAAIFPSGFSRRSQWIDKGPCSAPREEELRPPQMAPIAANDLNAQIHAQPSHQRCIIPPLKRSSSPQLERGPNRQLICLQPFMNIDSRKSSKLERSVPALRPPVPYPLSDPRFSGPPTTDN